MTGSPAVGATWQGDYLLQATLGDPAHGVFRAQRRRDSQTVTLRLWRAPNDALARAFLEAATAARAVRHPALAQVEDCGREGDLCFIVSEYIVGQKLDTWADQVGIPPLPDVIKLMRQLCEGLHVAALGGAPHSALHPRNVAMLHADSPNARSTQPKLLDLGIPTFARPRQPHALAGQFMAPEQLICLLDESSPPLPETDTAMNVYSCGALLYYLCTGGPPFRQVELHALREAQQHGRLALPSRINPQITASLNAVIVQALSQEPKQRFPSIGEFGEALTRVDLTASITGVRPLMPTPPTSTSGSVARKRPPPSPSRYSSVPPSPPPTRRPPPASTFFEPETETARTGPVPLAGRPPPTPWGHGPLVSGNSLDTQDSDRADRNSVPVGSFSSAPPAPMTKAPPQAVLATPLSLFSGAPNMRVEPALIVTRLDGGGSQLMSPHEVLSSGHPTGRRTRNVVAVFGSLAALVCFATYGVVKLVGGSGAAAPTGGAPIVPDKPQMEQLAANPPAAPASGVLVAPSLEPAVQPVPVAEYEESTRSRHEESGPSRNSRRATRSGAVVASREARTVAPAAMPAAAAGPDAETAAARQPEPDAPPPAIDAAFAADEASRKPVRAADAAIPGAPRPASAAAAPRQVSVQAVADNRPLEAKTAIGEISVRGPLPTSQVRRALERIRPQLSACYARAAQAAGRNQFGALDVEVDIDERGRARSPRVRGATLPGLNPCVAEAATKVICEAPDTGTVRASFKVVFTR